jgi:hypothetical protein
MPLRQLREASIHIPYLYMKDAVISITSLAFASTFIVFAVSHTINETSHHKKSQTLPVAMEISSPQVATSGK